MATMLGVVTCDAAVESDAWRKMVKRASMASFTQVGGGIWGAGCTGGLLLVVDG